MKFLARAYVNELYSVVLWEGEFTFPNIQD